MRVCTFFLHIFTRNESILIASNSIAKKCGFENHGYGNTNCTHTNDDPVLGAKPKLVFLGLCKLKERWIVCCLNS